MSNAEEIVEKIDTFLTKSRLKTFKLSNEEFLDFIETNWAEADDEKYHIRYSTIIVGRMMNEYAKLKEYENLDRWMAMHDKLDNFFNNTDYIINWYRASIYFDAGNEEKAFAYFKLSYDENPDYIFSRKSKYSKFIDLHFQNPNKSLEETTEEEEREETYFKIKLEVWQKFFKNEDEQLMFNFIDEEDELLDTPNALQQKAADYLVKNQEQILKSMLQSLLEKYPILQKQYNYSEEDKADFMPDITSIEGFSDLLSQSQCYVMNVYQNDFPYFGFSFGCSWDQEHDLGIITYKERVVEIGSADLAFDTYVAEKDLENQIN